MFAQRIGDVADHFGQRLHDFQTFADVQRRTIDVDQKLVNLAGTLANIGDGQGIKPTGNGADVQRHLGMARCSPFPNTEAELSCSHWVPALITFRYPYRTTQRHPAYYRISVQKPAGRHLRAACNSGT